MDEARKDRVHSVNEFMYTTKKQEMNKRIQEMDQKVQMALIRKQQALDKKAEERLKRQQ